MELRVIKETKFKYTFYRKVRNPEGIGGGVEPGSEGITFGIGTDRINTYHVIGKPFITDRYFSNQQILGILHEMNSSIDCEYEVDKVMKVGDSEIFYTLEHIDASVIGSWELGEGFRRGNG